MSPRLIRLLELLLREAGPVKVDTLAAALNTSRRTVFRELENSERILAPYKLELVSVPGLGVELKGEGRDELSALCGEQKALPGSRKERQLCLLLALLSNAGEFQKLFYYANRLGVSESTVSNDLDEMEAWLTERGVAVERKSGIGVSAEAGEEAVRAAMVNALIAGGDTGGRSYSAAFGYPGDGVEGGIREILRRNQSRLDWISPESYTMLSICLMVLAERALKGKFLKGGRAETEGRTFQARVAAELIAGIESAFGVKLPESEAAGLETYIKSCRSKQSSPLEFASGGQKDDMEKIVFSMIERFDPASAPVLKTNDQLVSLLTRHLEPALTRMESGLCLADPLEGRIEEQYPDVYRKTKEAVKELEKAAGRKVPESEITFCAIHFLAALAALDEKNIRRRMLRAGVVCIEGIGMSYMLASQLRKRFKGELEIEISGWNDGEENAEGAALEEVDFIISTIPLEKAGKPVIRVNAILGEEDYLNIQEEINKRALVEKKESAVSARLSLEKRLTRLEELFAETRKLFNSFTVKKIKNDCGFEELAAFAAKHFASGKGDNGQAAYKALLKREAALSQVISPLGIILLHARGSFVASPVFALIVPQGGAFRADYFLGAKSCVLMLLPSSSPPEMLRIMGSLSGALIDVPDFLEGIQKGDEKAIKAILETELADALIQYTQEKLKE